MYAYIRFADSVSAWFGKAAAWLIIMMALGTGYEVFVRYVLNNPTAWALDVSFVLYGTLVMMGGAYTLSRGGHVRGDFLYRLWAPRRQAQVDLVLYIFFFFPGVLALTFTGWSYAEQSWRFGEVSVNSPAGVPIYQFKTVIAVSGALLTLQGIAQVCRCIHCIKTNEWLPAEEDVEETEDILMKQAAAAEKDAHP